MSDTGACMLLVMKTVTVVGSACGELRWQRARHYYRAARAIAPKAVQVWREPSSER